jgi:hypothetical protein
MSNWSSTKTGELSGKIADAVRKVGDNHAEIAEHVDTAAKATRVVAALATVGATVSAPTGLSAIGVAIGVVSPPVIVTAVPILLAVAGGTSAMSAAASLYSKSRRKKSKNKLAK